MLFAPYECKDLIIISQESINTSLIIQRKIHFCNTILITKKKKVATEATLMETVAVIPRPDFSAEVNGGSGAVIPLHNQTMQGVG